MGADVADKKRACLIYVTATADDCGPVRARLEGAGYVVCEVRAELDDAWVAQAGVGDLPEGLSECIAQSDICVFLLPADQVSDGALSGAASLAQSAGKRMVGVVAGARDRYPEALDDHAGAMLRQGSGQLIAAIEGGEIWEKPGGTEAPVREIRHVRCQ
jgi:hypothetical protein